MKTMPVIAAAVGKGFVSHGSPEARPAANSANGELIINARNVPAS
jgi:hypothetical protein